MTGKITVGTIQDTDGNTVASTYVTSGVAKAWIHFNGQGTIATRDSFNISSITDDGLGDYITTVTSAMINNDYSMVGSTSPNYATTWSINLQVMHGNGNQEIDNSTTTQQFQSAGQNGSQYDAKYIMHNIHGDLA